MKKKYNINLLHIRPVYPGDMGVYRPLGENRAELLFKGTYNQCWEFIQKVDMEEILIPDAREDELC